MNDFTKEELINLRASLDVCIADDGSDEELMNKIQSMIDNYCAHEWRTTTPDILHCIICKTNIGDLK